MKRLQQHITFRDLFFGTLATGILVDQVLIVNHAQPILIFLVIFLYGAVPALRSDERPGHHSPFARFIMIILGIPFPEGQDDQEGAGGHGSHHTPTSSGTEVPAQPSQSPPRSSDEVS